MKNSTFLFATAITAIAFISCGNGKAPSADAEHPNSIVSNIAEVATDNSANVNGTIMLDAFSVAKETKYAMVSVEAQIPVGDDAVSVAIRNSLLDIVDKDFAFNFEGTRVTPKYKDKDINGCLAYYAKCRLQYLTADSKQTNEDMDNEELMVSSDELRIVKSSETAAYIVFCIAGSTYNAGAAHPNNAGTTAVFSKKTGKVFTHFLKDGVEAKMQKLLVKGLIDYFKDCYEDVNEETLWENLLLDKRYIPLPADAPSPQKDGLTFSYQDYEIAPHAAGMPSFTIPYKAIKPYLTDEAIELLGL